MKNQIDLSKTFAARLNSVYMGEYPTIRPWSFPPIRRGEKYMGRIQHDLTRSLFALYVDIAREVESYKVLEVDKEGLRLNMSVAYRIWWQQVLYELGHPDANQAQAYLIVLRKGWRVVRP